MKNNILTWQQMVLTLPDENFFQLMQTWLGELKTPFNKHQLLQRLTTFISSENIIDQICSLVDSLDSKILSAIYLIQNPTIKTLYKIVGKTITYSTFSLKLINLEQRLLIYRNKENEDSAIFINPYLIEKLKKEHLNLNSLIRPYCCNPKKRKIPWVNDSVLLGMLSYIEEKHPSIKINNIWKKKELDDLAKIFPALKTSLTGINRCEMIKGILFKLNLVEINNNRLVNKISNWIELENFESRELFLSLLTAACFWAEEIKSDEDTLEVVQPLLQKNIFFGIQLFTHLMRALPPGNFYPHDDFISILQLCSPENSPCNFKRYMQALIECEVLVTEQNHYIGLNPIFDIDKIYPSPVPSAVIESSFDVILKPGVPFKDAILIPMIGDIVLCEQYPHYQISQKSFVRALKIGLSQNQIVEKLNLLTQNYIPQNLSQNIDHWTKNYLRLRLIRGLILKVNPTDSLVIKKSKILDKWIIEELADGIFLMDESNIPHWEEALLRIGIQNIPGIETPNSPLVENKKLSFPTIENISPKILPHYKTCYKPFSEDEENKPQSHPNYDEIIDKIDRVTQDKEEKEELLAKMNKKLILFPEQIFTFSTKFEKKEAHGLDFRGKLGVIKHALASGQEILEVKLLSMEKNPPMILLFPKNLTQNLNIQILRGLSVEDDSPVEISVNKIKSVRRLQSSLFCPDK